MVCHESICIVANTVVIVKYNLGVFVMKINLSSAFMRGDEIFTVTVVTPSTVLIYNKLVAINNRLGWKNLVIKTSIKGLSDATHLRTNVTRKSLQELINLDMIMVVNRVDFASNFTSTLHSLYIDFTSFCFPKSVIKPL